MTQDMQIMSKPAASRLARWFVNSKHLVFACLVLAAALAGCDAITPSTDFVDPRTVDWRVGTVLPAGSGTAHAFMGVYGKHVSNLYAVALSDNRGGQLWRFNGIDWGEVSFPRPSNAGIAVTLMDIDGIDDNSIWAVGYYSYLSSFDPPVFVDSSYIIFFDGSSWAVQHEGVGGALYGVHAHSRNDVWAGGAAGLMYHFDGSSWTRSMLTLPVSIAEITSTHDGSFFATAYKADSLQDNSFYLLSYANGTWSVIDEDHEENSLQKRFGISGLGLSSNGLLTVGFGVYARRHSSWTRLFYHPTSSLFSLKVLPNQTLLAGSAESELYFYDAKDWYGIDVAFPPHTRISAIWSDGTDYLVLGYQSGFTKSYFAQSRTH